MRDDVNPSGDKLSPLGFFVYSHLKLNDYKQQLKGKKMKKIKIEAGELVLASIVMPKDLNMQSAGFGGWTLALLDLAGSVPARRIAHSQNARVVTKAVNHVEFIAPIHLGDRVSVFAEVVARGKTSVVVQMRAEAERYDNGEVLTVAEAEYVYVILNKREEKE